MNPSRSVEQSVLILVVVDDGLVHTYTDEQIIQATSLNPCCSGRWSRTYCMDLDASTDDVVLILVVVDDGLVRTYA